MKFYKKMILNYVAFLLVLVGNSSCHKDQMLNIKDSWVCNPEPNISIILTFDSEQVYVTTSPQNLAGVLMSNGKTYLFNNGDQYIVHEDTLHFVDINSNAPSANYGFIRTMLSSNSMKLQSYGIGFPAFGIYVTEYMFQRKAN